MAYLKKWNELFGNELEVSGQDIVSSRPSGISWNDLTPKEFSEAFKKALEKKIGVERVVYTKTGEKLVYTQEAMEVRLAKAFDAYKQQLQKKVS